MFSSGKPQIALMIGLVVILAACGPSPTAKVELPTIEPEAIPTQIIATCADIDASWGRDWPAVLTALEHLMAAGQTCGAEPLAGKKYAAHFNYGAVLEANEDVEAAISQYQAALGLDPNRQEALNALVHLDALPAPTPAPCLSSSAPRPDPAPIEAPNLASFVTVSNDQLLLDGEVFKVKGVNYYPRHTPWHRFLEESDPAEMVAELDLIKQAGFNTLRVFLWYQPLFTCEPETAIPNEAGFATVDRLLQLAGERDLKLIVTLNDLPDLRFRPLYTDWEHYDAQTVYIVRRYRNEPSILGWDLRNEGDIDYGAQSSEHELFSQEEVINWLGHISQVVRENDPYHLITAGWWGDPLVTSAYVDFLSFHQFDTFDTQQLQRRIEAYKRGSDQPLLLQEVGYHSWGEAPEGPRDELTQAEILGNVVNTVAETDISGWVVWTAFDFVLAPGQLANYEHFFGLWRTDLTPKPVLEALPLE
jgi:hypothetical protein